MKRTKFCIWYLQIMCNTTNQVFLHLRQTCFIYYSAFAPVFLSESGFTTVPTSAACGASTLANVAANSESLYYCDCSNVLVLSPVSHQNRFSTDLCNFKWIAITVKTIILRCQCWSSSRAPCIQLNHRLKATSSPLLIHQICNLQHGHNGCFVFQRTICVQPSVLANWLIKECK